MKKKKLVMVVAIVVVAIIASASVLSSAIELKNDGTFSSVEFKKFLSEMLNDESISKSDREEMSELLNMPQLFDDTSDTKDANGELNNNSENYNIIIKYIISIVNNNPEREHICLGVDGYNKEDIILWDAADDGEILNITDDVSYALSHIKQSFSKMGYQFDAIRVESGRILFDTIDGQYALIYNIDNLALSNEEKDDTRIIVESTKENWYHSFPN